MVDTIHLFLLENYGVLMLHSLFEYWSVNKQALGMRPAHALFDLHVLSPMASEANDGYAERIHFDNLCHLPGHTPIFVGEIGGRTLYRFRCSEAAGEPEQSFLHEVLPSFVTNVIIRVRLLPTRIALIFVVLPSS